MHLRLISSRLSAINHDRSNHFHFDRKEQILNEDIPSGNIVEVTVPKVRRRLSLLEIICIVLVPVLVIVIIVAALDVFTPSAAPVATPTHTYTPPERVEIERTPPPVDLPDIVYAAGVPTRLQIPTRSFDTDTLVLPATQTERIIQWTQEMNMAHGGGINPPQPWSTSVVWDSTVAGGGLFGPSADTRHVMACHVTPNTWPEDKIGACQTLLKAEAGDPVAVTTTEGLLCGRITKVDVIPKNNKIKVGERWMYLSDYKYRLSPPTPEEWFVIGLCNRLEDDQTTNATTENKFLIIQYDQDQTNTGACW